MQTNETITVAADKDFFETIERTTINPDKPDQPDTSTKYSPGMIRVVQTWIFGISLKQCSRDVTMRAANR